MKKADSGRYYRYDGKGDLPNAEIRSYDTGREYENGYRRTHNET